jgi:hypothetical protein
MSMSSEVPRTHEQRSYGRDVEPQREGKVARMIEHEAQKIPTDVFLIAAAAAVVGSAVIQLGSVFGRRSFGMAKRGGQLSLFIGQWAPTFLLLGLYNKMLKIAQHEGRLHSD